MLRKLIDGVTAIARRRKEERTRLQLELVAVVHSTVALECAIADVQDAIGRLDSFSEVGELSIYHDTKMELQRMVVALYARQRVLKKQLGDVSVPMPGPPQTGSLTNENTR